MTSLRSELEQLLGASQQEKLLKHFDSLSEQQQATLVEQIRAIGATSNFAHLQQVFRTTMRVLEESRTQSDRLVRIEPPSQSDIVDLTADDSSRTEQLSVLGRASLARGEVAVLVLAGGSGTRLGQSFPKGMLVCDNLLLQKSLFALQAEKIRRMESILGSGGETTIPYLIMTSQQTDAATKSFFEQHQHFGLNASQVFFFMQSSLPCYSLEGEILLEAEDRIATAPGGNAGIYAALESSGGLRWLDERNVKYVQIVTIDNLLVQLPDPVLVGVALDDPNTFADVVVKTVPKVNDEEAVGVFAKKEAREGVVVGEPSSLVWGVVEYSELPPQMAKARTTDGTNMRLFDHGNIAVHLVSLPFLQFAAQKMTTYEYYHAAVKAIPTHGNTTTKGVKLEAFIFDIFEFAKTLKILKVVRSEEFSPIKNADDAGHAKPDSPFTALRDLRALHTRWATQAGLPATTVDPEGVQHSLLYEISPLVSLRGESLKENVSAWCTAVGTALSADGSATVVALLPGFEVKTFSTTTVGKL